MPTLPKAPPEVAGPSLPRGIAEQATNAAQVRAETKTPQAPQVIQAGALFRKLPREPTVAESTPPRPYLPRDFDWRQYVALNADLAGLTTREAAEAHWLATGFAQMRLYKRSQLVVTHEFSTELIRSVGYYYYLHTAGLLFGNKVETFPGMRAVYYFLRPEQLVENTGRGKRHWAHDHRLLVNRCEFSSAHFLYDYLRVPPYREVYRNTLFVADRPLLVIYNKYNSEWGGPPKNYIGCDTLRRLLDRLMNRFQIVYLRPGAEHGGLLQHKGFSADGNEFAHGFGDRALLQREPYASRVWTLDDVLRRDPARGFNELQLMLFANCRHYISSQGGSSHISTLFAERQIVLHARGDELRCGVYQGWYHRLHAGADPRVPKNLALWVVPRHEDILVALDDFLKGDVAVPF